MNLYLNTLLANLTTDELREIFSERRMLQLWLDVEAALAYAEAEVGFIPEHAAKIIQENARLEKLDIDHVFQEIRRTGHELMPLINELARVSGPAGEYVHWGATTQDIIDTAVVMQLRDALGIMEADLKALIRNLIPLAEDHQETVMTARTHLQYAAPTTFGFKVAVWLSEFLRHLDRFEPIRQRVLVGQLSGAVGTLAGFGDRGIEVQSLALGRLGLRAPEIAWQSARDNFAELATFCGMLGSSLGKVANEIVNLQRTEVGELEQRQPEGTIGSSTMPHKRNPAACENVVGASRILQSTASILLSTMVAVHERDGGTWIAEIATLPEAVMIAAGALHTMCEVTHHLGVNRERMLQNVGAMHGLVLSEAIMLELATKMGRQSAHKLVYDVAMACQKDGLSFVDTMMAHEKVKTLIPLDRIPKLLSPAGNTGKARYFAQAMADKAKERVGYFRGPLFRS